MEGCEHKLHPHTIPQSKKSRDCVHYVERKHYRSRGSSVLGALAM